VGVLTRQLSILILFLSVFSIGVAQDAPADNWAQFRGNHQLTGVSQANVPATL